ncbi:hypothetical protein [Methylobacterium platani]|uniref:Uncharacterized protein n=1 Tax=Methylobacterium platani TaxID=427683 RepID=A0A179SG57_9HYPH|nr:hypothetical protein [Methylobacterium platani]OAS26422.1 hypothetical protein A5481_05025 [Methylobacterium platani]
MQRPLIILGTGGNALDIPDRVGSRPGSRRVAGFRDDARPEGGRAGATAAGNPGRTPRTGA